jgi:light-regulated signal transduction histidine kinase (bacteriophytochrome)
MMPPQFIAQCESELLQSSGAIQGYGTLLVCSSDYEITHLAANLGDFFPPSQNIVVGTRLPDPLAAMSLTLDKVPGSRIRRAAGFNCQCGALDVAMARTSSQNIVTELTLHRRYDAMPWAGQITTATDDKAWLVQQERLLQRIFDMTGCYRVMYYQFRDDGDGEVIAEVRQQDVYGSYLGLRFPASDVPQIARSLYLLNPWRLISDAAADSVPLQGDTGSIPDLTYSDLRSVSPVHAAYLANMGVRASLSFPIVIRGELAGLVACHHPEPRVLPMQLLVAIEREIRSSAIATTAFLAQQRIRLVENLNVHFDRILAILDEHEGITAAWPRVGEWLGEQFLAEGAYYCHESDHASWGLTPSAETVKEIDTWFSTQPSMLWTTDCIGRDISDVSASNVAGVLAIKIRWTNSQNLRIYICRGEYIHEVAWGGQPEKPVERDDGQVSISPRRSFDKWVETRLGHSRPWGDKERLRSLKLVGLLHRARPS